MKRNAYWIWETDQFIYGKQSVFFRRTFDYKKGKPLSVMVSADSRFKLYVNGRYVISGPMKGDKFRKYYDTVDITSYLQEGKNVIAAHVLRFPEDYLAAMNFHCGPISLTGSSRGGFWLDSKDADICTDSRWKCKPDASYQFREAEESKYAGDQELCFADRYEQGWNQTEYDDSAWAYAALVCPSAGRRPLRMAAASPHDPDAAGDPDSPESHYKATDSFGFYPPAAKSRGGYSASYRYLF